MARTPNKKRASKKGTNTKTKQKVKQNKTKKKRTIASVNEKVNYFDLQKLSDTEKIKATQKLANRANTRLKAFEKLPESEQSYAYKKAKTFLHSIGRESFYRGKNYDLSKSHKELNQMILELENFLNAKTSTITGFKQTKRQTAQRIEDKVNTERAKYGLEPIKIEDADTFFEFLGSKQFRALKQQADSNQVIEDAMLAFSQGFTINEIMQDYEHFLMGRIKTFNTLNARRVSEMKRNNRKGLLR